MFDPEARMRRINRGWSTPAVPDCRKSAGMGAAGQSDADCGGARRRLRAGLNTQRMPVYVEQF